mmetsp:Transcript_2502/g.9684  ORF Transcript_2502/g.9684 Transcript_2502/m.9684 type:complete len:281 (-) Transcript_2502:556-1398(-)
MARRRRSVQTFSRLYVSSATGLSPPPQSPAPSSFALRTSSRNLFLGLPFFPSLKNCLRVATWFSTACFPSPVLLDVKIIGGSSSQYSLTSRQKASTFSSGLARFPLFTFRFLSTFVNTTVTGMLFSPRNSRHSRSSRCGLTVESISSITDSKLGLSRRYSRVNSAHLRRASSGALAKPYPGKSTKYHVPSPVIISKWLIVRVLPGFFDVLATGVLVRLVSMFTSDDLPTLDRPMTATSGCLGGGQSLTLTHACMKRTDLTMAPLACWTVAWVRPSASSVR